MSFPDETEPLGKNPNFPFDFSDEEEDEEFIDEEDIDSDIDIESVEEGEGEEQNLPEISGGNAVDTVLKENPEFDIEKFLPPGNDLSKADKKLLKDYKKVLNDRGGFLISSSIMKCNGAHCYLVQDVQRQKDPNAERDLTKCFCPLYQIEKEPLNFPCPLESLDAEKLLRDTITGLKIDDRNVGDVAIVQELVSFMLLQGRLMRELSQSPSTLLEEVTYTPKSTTVKQVLNPLISAIKDITALISRKRSELIATPDRRHTTRMQQVAAEVEVTTATLKLKKMMVEEAEQHAPNRNVIIEQTLSEPPPSIVGRDDEAQREKEAALAKIKATAPDIFQEESPFDDD